MAAARSTTDDELAAAHAKLVRTFRTGRTKSLEWRRSQLEAIRLMCVEHAADMTDAVVADLGRPRMEALLAEVSVNISEVDFMLEHLESWMKPEPVGTPLLQQPGKSEVVREPKGVVLFLAPWNFPINLSLGPLMAAVASGNCCLLKPSEVSPHSEKLLVTLIAKYLDTDAIIAVPGGVEESTSLLKLKWDHIMYTGNSLVGRVVARAAAENLTPCTLELGGKSPTLILPGANITVAVRRMLAGKFLNAGQICIAPDYLLVHADVEQQVVKEMEKTLTSWYGEDASSSTSFGRIINERHFKRVQGLLDTSEAEVISLGRPDASQKFIPPTLLREPNPKAPVMREEIFGPLLPIVKMDTTQQMVDYINSGEKPLAVYIFGPEAAARDVISQTSSGGVCVNDTLFHFGNPNLPFGGVGESGTGRYHGKFGFDEFSHIRGVLIRKTFLDLPQRYPPYTDSNMRLLEKIMVGPLISASAKKVLAAAGAVGAGAAAYAMRSRL